MAPDPGFAAALGAWGRVGLDLGLGMGAALALRGLSAERARQAQIRACRRVLDDLGVVLRVEDRSGLPAGDRRPVLFVHLDQQTLLSIPIYPLVLDRPFSLVVNVEFALLPLAGWYAVADGGVVVVRQWPAQARGALRRVTERLRGGRTFGMSIEGRRTDDGALSPYKKGAAVLAIDAQCDIVPFMTHGEWDLWPRGSWRVRPGLVEAVLYPKVSTRGLRYEDRDALVAELRALAVRERRLRGIARERT